MPVHDWSRVGDGIFHDFHGKWISAISTALNQGLLPADYYTVTESYAGDTIADVLTLKTGDQTGFDNHGDEPGHPSATAVAVAQPQVNLVETALDDALLSKQRRVVVRHSSDDRIIALIEIISKGNKARQEALDLFVGKVVQALRQGWHLLIIDLHRPSPRDPAGIHGAIWPQVGGEATYQVRDDKPLTLVAYEATSPKRAYIEPIAVGDVLPEMPLFLSPGWYVNIPLEPSYQVAWQGVPGRWRAVLE